jgi:class 3 adenylate cyclase/streptogramin lyase
VTIRRVSELPSGTVTLLFTDVEGSTQLQHRLRESYQDVVAEHRRLLERAFAEHGGVVVDRQTESYFVAFPRARFAVAAAAAAQRALAEHKWPEGTDVKVRMGIHSGDPEVAGDRYVGLAVSRAARICASAHGGQVLLSSSVRALLSDHEQTALRSLGRYRLKDFTEPEPISQLVVDGLPSQFPPPRTEVAPSRRKRIVLAAAVVVLAGAIAGVAAALTAGGSSVKVGPTSLAVIDPKSNKVTKAIDLGFKSNLIAAGEGFVWVVDPQGSTLWKIDPRSRRVKSIFPLAVGAGEVPFGLAVGQGSVWVAVQRGSHEVVLELGPAVGDLRRTIPYGEAVKAPVLVWLQPVAVGGGAVWALDPAVGGLWRIPTRAGRAQRLAEGLDARSLAFGDGAVWVAGSLGVDKVDASTGLQLASQSGGSAAVAETASVAPTANAVWYVASSGPTLSKLDPQSLDVRQTLTVGKGPSGVAIGDGAVWVANSGDGTITRVDLRSGKTRTIKLGASAPSGIVAAYGAVWTSPGVARS